MKLKPGCVCMRCCCASKLALGTSVATDSTLSPARAEGMSYVCGRLSLSRMGGSACRLCPHTRMTRLEKMPDEADEVVGTVLGWERWDGKS